MSGFSVHSSLPLFTAGLSFQQTEWMNLFIYSQKKWTFWVYKNNWLAVFIVYLCVPIHVYPFFFVPRLFEEKWRDTVFGFPWGVVRGAWCVVPSF